MSLTSGSRSSGPQRPEAAHLVDQPRGQGVVRPADGRRVRRGLDPPQDGRDQVAEIRLVQGRRGLGVQRFEHPAVVVRHHRLEAVLRVGFGRPRSRRRVGVRWLLAHAPAMSNRSDGQRPLLPRRVLVSKHQNSRCTGCLQALWRPFRGILAARLHIGEASRKAVHDAARRTATKRRRGLRRCSPVARTSGEPVERSSRPALPTTSHRRADTASVGTRREEGRSGARTGRIRPRWATRE